MSRYSNSSRRVRFNLPDDHNDQPPSILRRTTRANIDLDETSQPTLARRSSLPSSSSMSRSARLRSLEALYGLREHVKDACNFHGEDYRRALSVPSVDSLYKLAAYIGELRGDGTSKRGRSDERLLHKYLECSKRHPHEQLYENDDFVTRHARNAVTAHRKRARREADFHLLNFVSSQLKLPTRALQELSTKQRREREMQAFEERIKKFYGPRRGGNSSAPQSPAGRPLTAPRSPATDPQRWEMQHGRLSETADDLFHEEIEDLSLPMSHDRRSYPSRPTHPKQTPPLQPMASPYGTVHLTPQQGFQPSPYAYPGIPVAGYQRTPPQPPLSMPYATHPYGQPAHMSQGQAYAPQPMNLPQAVGTPQQTPLQQPMISPMQTPLQTPLQQPMQTPQQRPMSHPGQQPLNRVPQQTILPQSISQTPLQQPLHPAQPGHTQPMMAPVSQAGHMPQVVYQQAQGNGQKVTGSQGFVQGATVIPTVVPTMAQGYHMAQPQLVQGQFAYPQARQTVPTQVGPMPQQGQQAQYMPGYYSHNAGALRQQQQQGQQQIRPQQEQRKE